MFSLFKHSLRFVQEPIIRSTTILAIRKNDEVVMIGDGQVTCNQTILKANAQKVKRLKANNNVIAGFAGATSDALTLLDRLEEKLQKFPTQLLRAAVELAKDWRTDKYLRHLEAQILVADENVSLQVTGTGDVIDIGDIGGIGSGGLIAISAARALHEFDLSAESIAMKAMKIASDLCIYTNSSFVCEKIKNK